MMDKEKLNKMKTYSFLLPDPGGEVVRECIDKIEALEAENATLRQFVKDVSEDMVCLTTCDSYGHDELCPFAHPIEAWRKLKEENAALHQQNAELVEALDEIAHSAPIDSDRK
jgi:predicted metal-binding protein